jgi:hypothetical protein
VFLKMKLSIYTSLFNIESGLFDLEDALANWSKYADEIVIATFDDEKDNIVTAIKYAAEAISFKGGIKVVMKKDTNLDDPLFDGKLKNAALQACSNKIVIQQDFDERIGGEKGYWKDLAERIIQLKIPLGCHIPVIDLYKDLDSYKSVNTKWYIHTKAGTERGPVNFAIRKDGTIDITKSDSCELINHNGDLISSVADLRFKQQEPQIEGEKFNVCFPHVIHLGHLDLQKRAQNNKFRQKCWSNLNGSEVEVATDVAALEKENDARPHGLKKEWWKK